MRPAVTAADGEAVQSQRPMKRRSELLGAGMMTVIPQAMWHRFRSAEGVTLMTATPLPSETIEDDLDDPRIVASKPE